MSELLRGIVKVPVAASPTAFTFEISATLTVDSEFITAVNKATSGFSSQQPTTRSWSIEVECHLDDTTNPALDIVKAAALAGTLLADCEFETTVTGWTFTGDAYPGNLTVTSGASDFLTVGFRLGGSGALVAS